MTDSRNERNPYPTSFAVLLLTALSLGFAASANAQVPVGTAFTYQGELHASGTPANGAYDFQFRLFDDPDFTMGVQIGPTVTIDEVAVQGGVFTAEPDFGAGVFAGDAYWLEVSVRDGASVGAFTVLSPRQAISSTPYATYSQEAGLALAVLPDSIGSSEIASGAVNSSHIATNAIGSAELAPDAVVGSHIVNNTITSADIGANAVGSSELAPNAVTSAHIAADTITTDDIGLWAVRSPDIFPGAVTSGHIALDTITAADIGANAVGSSELADNAVTSAKIASNTITAADIGADAVRGSELASVFVDATKFLAAPAISSSDPVSSDVSASTYELCILAVVQIVEGGQGSGGGTCSMSYVSSSNEWRVTANPSGNGSVFCQMLCFDW